MLQPLTLATLLSYNRRRFPLRLLILPLFLLLLALPTTGKAEEKVLLGVSTELTGEAGTTFGYDIRDVLIFANEKISGNHYKLDIQDVPVAPQNPMM